MYKIKNINNFLIKNYKNYLSQPKESEIKKKNLKEVSREFNSEEWQKLYKKLIQKGFKKVTDADHNYINFKKKSYFYLKSNFYKNNNKYIFYKYIDLYKETLKKYLSKRKKNNLVELGSGYGSKIINLGMMLNSNYHIDYFAGELSLNGRKITDHLSKNANFKVKTFKFNFLDQNTYKFIPLKSIIYTSYSMHYMLNIDPDFFYNLKKRKPLIIINFEPLFEVHDEKKLYGRLCRNYILKNGYCLNQFSLMYEKQKKKEIQIINIKKNIFGSNPILPISRIIWKFS